MASSKMLASDEKRRVKAIQKMIKDIQNMGIPCAFVYLTKWTVGLYIGGDDRITAEIKDSVGYFKKDARQQ